ncbi:Atrazine chlorohydrolase [Neomoorella glycerini]|uniref:Atrazine chlorohydrolase n=1 Tax=Neomoorella glycerini TaxID=55779 RepID=A0A6I5ZMI0_9FIRM|nr:amidohydrolase [Moorella glycerini]QGP91094.1 Atrazine chlorohydrolase [Moorella glycerini]
MKEVDLIVVGGTIVTMDAARTIIFNGALAIEGSKIVAMGTSAEITAAYKGRKLINAKGHYIFPGLINSHTHLFQTLLKGLAADTPLQTWIARLITPVVPLLSEEDCYYAAQLGILEAIRSGTTTLLDFMYLTCHPEFSEAVITAAQTTGIRLLFGRGVHDTGVNRGVPPQLIEDVDTVLTEVDYLRRQYELKSDGMIHIWLAPSVMWGMSYSGLRSLAAYATENKVPITMHLMETDYDIDLCQADYGKRPLEILAEMGMLANHFLLVHGVQAEESDLQLMDAYRVSWSHCMAANLYLGSGVAPITRASPATAVSLATDGAASNNSQNMIELLKLTALVHKGVYRNPGIINASRIIAMATCEGARAVGMEKQIGTLAPGYRADLFIVNPGLPTTTPVHDPLATLVYSCDQENIETVIINGKIVMHCRHLLTINEEEVVNKVQDIARRLRDKLNI